VFWDALRHRNNGNGPPPLRHLSLAINRIDLTAEAAYIQGLQRLELKDCRIAGFQYLPRCHVLHLSNVLNRLHLPAWEALVGRIAETVYDFHVDAQDLLRLGDEDCERPLHPLSQLRHLTVYVTAIAEWRQFLARGWIPPTVDLLVVEWPFADEFSVGEIREAYEWQVPAARRQGMCMQIRGVD
jgi:hypothetical protein